MEKAEPPSKNEDLKEHAAPRAQQVVFFVDVKPSVRPVRVGGFLFKAHLIPICYLGKGNQTVINHDRK